MGALEYAPAIKMKSLNVSREVEIESLVNRAQEVLDERGGLAVELGGDGKEDREAMMSPLSVGMSAGGARPKAVVAFNESFSKVRSGQQSYPKIIPII